jgi:hypothetical protein
MSPVNPDRGPPYKLPFSYAEKCIFSGTHWELCLSLDQGCLGHTYLWGYRAGVYSTDALQPPEIEEKQKIEKKLGRALEELVGEHTLLVVNQVWNRKRLHSKFRHVKVDYYPRHATEKPFGGLVFYDFTYYDNEDPPMQRILTTEAEFKMYVELREGFRKCFS